MLDDDNELTITIAASINEFDAQKWDEMVENNHPFLKHAFLNALETNQCVHQKFGWIPMHIGIFRESVLVAALPVYEKHNNYGEFVFDQPWEQAWNQIGLPYYPKMVTATPYTPVMGQRFLIHPTLADDSPEFEEQLYKAFTHLCEQKNYSGAHILFSIPKQQQWLLKQQHSDSHLYHRLDCQFHWQNQSYQTFEDFLKKLKPKKRKNIQRERRLIKEAGVTFRVLNGHQATENDWHEFDYFYQKTFLEKWSTPTLNVDFFMDIGKSIPDQIVLVLADLESKCIAGALMFKSDTHLYGRHWGAGQEIKNLHFETCFYQGIEFAIEHGLKTFEPGAGGEHKIARGFSPVYIHSFHWLPLNPFGTNLDNYIAEETKALKAYHDECIKHTPYQSC